MTRFNALSSTALLLLASLSVPTDSYAFNLSRSAFTPAADVAILTPPPAHSKRTAPTLGPCEWSAEQSIPFYPLISMHEFGEL